MKPKILSLSLITILLCSAVFSQDHNPFKSIGKKGKVLTLSNGKYDEVFENDSLERIGTVLVNRYTRKIEKLLSNEQSVNVYTNVEQSRFLSVDPLTQKFAELSPYQYASNRPIDGIDLDGEEWEKVETFNPQTHGNNIQFEVKLKVVNESKLFENVQALKAEIQKQFAAAFVELQNKNRKTTYSASIIVDIADNFKSNDFGVLILDASKPNPGYRGIAGITGSINTKENIFSVTGSKYVGDAQKIKGPSNIAQDIIHELFHTAGVSHPQDDNNTAQDVDLVPVYSRSTNGIKKEFKTYILGKNATLQRVVYNIMTYGEVKINGKLVRKYEPDDLRRNKLSQDQAKIITKQINSDNNQINKKQ